MKRTSVVFSRGHWLLGSALFLCLAVAANTQQLQKRENETGTMPNYPQPLQSDLTRDNYDRVAASPAQLKEVLIKDPGLMVELKRWIAKEASDSGQIVTDEDLTDTAVFDRLGADIKFRSVATRLVQRYGYLRPNVDPNSEIGKQQELLIKERVRRLVQIEAQEDAESTRQPKTQTTEAKAGSCDSNDDRECVQGAQERPRRAVSSPDGSNPERESAPSNPNDGQPMSSSSRILQAGVNPGDSLFGITGENSPSIRNVSNSLKPPSDPRFSANISSDPLNPSPIEQERGSAARDNLAESAPGYASASMNARNDLGGGTTSRREQRLAKDHDLSPATMVRRPNPYADIPSLYDLYVQAPSRDRQPQRFGADIFKDGLRDPRSIPMDLPVGPDYVVGPGDSLSIDLWGGISTKLTRVVDRQGRVTLPEAGPLLVSGRSLGEVQSAVQRAIGTQYRDTSADVSVSRLRTVRIYVVGEVEEPGAYDISSLSTALNALVAAGGVTPRGSLRSLKHMRGRQELEQIDAYDLLLRGVAPDAKRLENGDTLMVPPMGAQVTVTGMVRRPAIYELNGEKTVAEVLDLSGGILPAAALRHVEVHGITAAEWNALCICPIRKCTGLQRECSPRAHTAAS